MKATYRKLNRNNKQLIKANELYKVIQEAVYYDVFSNEHTRQADLRACFESQKNLLNERHLLLEEMQISIRREQSKVSFEFKNLKIQEICRQKLAN